MSMPRWSEDDWNEGHKQPMRLDDRKGFCSIHGCANKAGQGTVKVTVNNVEQTYPLCDSCHKKIVDYLYGSGTGFSSKTAAPETGMPVSGAAETHGPETEPTTDQMIADLLGGGWTMVRHDLWCAPWDALYRGPHLAWHKWAGTPMCKPKDGK